MARMFFLNSDQIAKLSSLLLLFFEGVIFGLIDAFSYIYFL